MSAKTKRIRARIMWLCDNGELFSNKKDPATVFPFKLKPVAVLDVSDEEAIVRQLVKAIDDAEAWNTEGAARAMIESLNFIKKRRAK